MDRLRELVTGASATADSCAAVLGHLMMKLTNTHLQPRRMAIKVRTIHGKTLAGKKLLNLVNHELFTKIFLTNIHRHTEMYLAYALAVAYLPNFSSPIAFTCMVDQIFPTKYFPCTVYPVFSIPWQLLNVVDVFYSLPLSMFQALVEIFDGFEVAAAKPVHKTAQEAWLLQAIPCLPHFTVMKSQLLSYIREVMTCCCHGMCFVSGVLFVVPSG